MTQGPVHFTDAATHRPDPPCGAATPYISSNVIDAVTCEDCLKAMKDGSPHEQSPQNAREVSEYPSTEGSGVSGYRETGPVMAQLLYRLMRDHGISPDQLRAHVAECRDEEACYTDAALGLVAVQVVQDLLPAHDAEDHNPDGFVHASPEVARVIGDAVARRLGAWDGPFTVAKELVFADMITPDNLVIVMDAAGAPFVMVAVGDCVGGELGAKARATRIAECLNRDQHFYERKLADDDADPHWQDEHGGVFPWMVESRGVNVPHFVVTLTGDCWWDIERNLADARKRLHHTAPPQEDQT